MKGELLNKLKNYEYDIISLKNSGQSGSHSCAYIRDTVFSFYFDSCG